MPTLSREAVLVACPNTPAYLPNHAHSVINLERYSVRFSQIKTQIVHFKGGMMRLKITDIWRAVIGDVLKKRLLYTTVTSFTGDDSV